MKRDFELWQTIYWIWFWNLGHFVVKILWVFCAIWAFLNGAIWGVLSTVYSQVLFFFSILGGVDLILQHTLNSRYKNCTILLCFGLFIRFTVGNCAKQMGQMYQNEVKGNKTFQAIVLRTIVHSLQILFTIPVLQAVIGCFYYTLPII